LELHDAKAYQSYLASHTHEWATLESLCRVTISRFYRDRGVFDALRHRVLPHLAAAAVERGEDRVRCWSAGCASGEEPFTLAIIWRCDDLPSVLEVIATDADDKLLTRARSGRYHKSSLKDLPDDLREAAFILKENEYVIDDAIKHVVDFERRDIRDDPPPGPFDVILCRNLAFTYYDDRGQEAVLSAMTRVLAPGGFLVIGVHERLPAGAADMALFDDIPGVYRFRPPVAHAT
jgi:chemotaxis protein methyltransferase CheR